MPSCSHKVAADHIERRDPRGQTWWRCSECAHVGLWREGFSYFGNIECTKCQATAMDRVLCAKCTLMRPTEAALARQLQVDSEKRAKDLKGLKAKRKALQRALDAIDDEIAEAEGEC